MSDVSLARGVLRSIDRADPTRSTEAKPSTRLASDRAFRRLRRVLVRCTFALIGVGALAIQLSR